MIWFKASLAPFPPLFPKATPPAPGDAAEDRSSKPTDFRCAPLTPFPFPTFPPFPLPLCSSAPSPTPLPAKPCGLCCWPSLPPKSQPCGFVSESILVPEESHKLRTLSLLAWDTKLRTASREDPCPPPSPSWKSKWPEELLSTLKLMPPTPSCPPVAPCLWPTCAASEGKAPMCRVINVPLDLFPNWMGSCKPPEGTRSNLSKTPSFKSSRPPAVGSFVPLGSSVPRKPFPPRTVWPTGRPTAPP
mmetsp:Transcript_63322/g.159688  ORF Transcript_63322/g.159688 Transcript_63322/m.159688 type:complete len:245 (+) Transcript_63322:273-1007(+)